MKPKLHLVQLTLVIALAGCTDSSPQARTGTPAGRQETASDTPGVSFALTTQTYDSATGSYGDSQILKRASLEQIESAIQSHNWLSGPTRPMIKLVRMGGGEVTAYLHIKRDQEGGDTILASWQSVATDNEFARTTKLPDKDTVLKTALAFATDSDLASVADWVDH